MKNSRAYMVKGRYTQCTLIVVADRGDELEVRWMSEWDYSFKVKRSDVRFTFKRELTKAAKADTMGT
jgi:hypothetical protein